jgi:membrane protease YdiL (CAAX protease family)
MTKNKQTEPNKTSLVPTVPWNPWLGLVFAAFVFYAAQFIAGLIASIYPLLKHWSEAQANDWLNSSAFAQFLFILLAEIATIGAIYLFVTKLYKSRLSIIGLRRPRWNDLFYGVVAVPVYFSFYLLTVVVVSHFVPSLNVNQQQEVGFNSAHGGLPLFLAFLSLVVLPPIAEEIMVRGFLYSSLKKAMSLIPAAIFTSVLFAVAHLPEGGSAGPLYIAAVDTFILSLVLIYLREKTGGLWSSMTLHAIKNCIAFVAIFAVHIR